MTDYHAKLFAYDLTTRCASDNVEKLTAVLSDAQVDLNPHQIEAAHRIAVDLSTDPARRNQRVQDLGRPCRHIRVSVSKRVVQQAK